MHVARQFPVDPANQAGFDNSGESLTMSPALLNKYLKAAREVADHVVLTPDGIDFAPYPMLVETDREKYAIQRIVSFLRRAAHRLCGLLRGRLALQVSSRPREARTPRWPPSRPMRR